MEIIEYTDEYKDRLFEFLINESKSVDSASDNMYDIDWENKPNTLPYKLLIEKQFQLFNIAIDNDDKIIGCSGCYISSFDDKFLLAGTRTWINVNYRNLQIPREYFLPVQKQWAVENNISAVGLCFNEYNKNIVETFKRIRLGEIRSEREPKHLFYNNLIEVEFPVVIQYTKQYLIYEKLIDSWDFDWESIRFTD